MIRWLVLLGLIGAPALPITQVSPTQLERVRDWVLLSILGIGSLWLWTSAPWLSVMGLWFMAQWRTEVSMPAVLLWVAIGALWFLLREIPSDWWSWIAWGWLAVAGWQIGVVMIRRWRLGGRQKGTLGTPVITALFLALISPFCPWWGWPVLILGLGLTWSWLAFLGVGIGMIWLAPRSSILVALASAGVALLWWWNPQVGRWKLLEWNPRGDSLDPWIGRWAVWRIIPAELTRERAWVFGLGPGTLDQRLMEWGSRGSPFVPPTEAHCDPLQHLWEYGLVGLVAAGLFIAPIVPRLRFGDPWSAAWLVGLVLSLGHWPFRNPLIGPVWMGMSAYLVRG